MPFQTEDFFNHAVKYVIGLNGVESLQIKQDKPLGWVCIKKQRIRRRSLWRGDMRRRLFWIIYSLDVMICVVVTGRPPVVSNSRVTTEPNGVRCVLKEQGMPATIGQVVQHHATISMLYRPSGASSIPDRHATTTALVGAREVIRRSKDLSRMARVDFSK
ncbi:hypothetical protein V866_006727 [Kwoniella sp. B9012]